MKHLIVGLIVLLLSACVATKLNSGASAINLISLEQATHCTQLKTISVNQRTGRDKAGNALRKALNEAAEAGANGIYIVSNSVDWAEGASLIVTAYRCNS